MTFLGNSIQVDNKFIYINLDKFVYIDIIERRLIIQLNSVSELLLELELRMPPPGHSQFHKTNENLMYTSVKTNDTMAISVKADDKFVYIDMDESVCFDLDELRIVIPLEQASAILLGLATVLLQSNTRKPLV